MQQPREGMMAIVRNRRAMITAVAPFDAEEQGRFHLVDVEYTDGLGVESDQVLWEVEPGREVLEPAALPNLGDTSPMDPREFDAMVRAARWSALTPSLPFSGLVEERPPLAAPLYGAIYPEAYQLVPVLRALDMPRVALLLADAVGLGKTIQAGMVLRELMLRRRIRRILVICPAALRTQWRDEMQDKFALPFEVVDRPQTLKLQKELGVDANPWRTHERIIASYHYLKQPDVMEQFRSAAEPGDDGRLRWDLLVVDEAHNLAPASFGADSDLAKMLQRIAPWFEHRLFLTASTSRWHSSRPGRPSYRWRRRNSRRASPPSWITFVASASCTTRRNSSKRCGRAATGGIGRSSTGTSRPSPVGRKAPSSRVARTICRPASRSGLARGRPRCGTRSLPGAYPTTTSSGSWRSSGPR